MFLLLTVLNLVFLTVYVEPVKDFDLILIAIPRHRKNILAPKKWLRSSPKNTKHDIKRLNLERLDVENYEDPTEEPDIDTFNYNDRQYDEKKFGKAVVRSKYGDDDDESYNDPDRIVGGFEVDVNLYPYHAGYGSNCGGAIISNQHVLTAGHCGKKPYVWVGSKYHTDGERVSVKRGIVHPKWSEENKEHPFDFDFQILELSEPLHFSESIQPVKIAQVDDVVPGKVLTVTGWGNTYENGPLSNVLRAVRVPIIEMDSCQAVRFPYFQGKLTARMFCAGYSEGNKDACQGDSGGPAVADGKLFGMVSFGYGCATPDSYGVYSKVSKVRDWIEKETRMKLT